MRADSLTWLEMKQKLGDIMHLYGYAEDLAKLKCLRDSQDPGLSGSEF